MDDENSRSPSGSRFKAVLFDFDYTLADSSPGVIACMNYALEHMGLPFAEPDTIRRMIGISLDESFRALAGDRRDVSVEEFKRLFVERGDHIMLEGTRVFESVLPVTRELKAGGVTLGIVSTKFRYRIEDILLRDRLLNMFSIIVGGEDVQAHKPDPAGLQKAMRKLGRAPAEVLYVGDSTVDAETAGRAGVLFVAVLTGPTPREAFRAYGRFPIISDLTELPPLLPAA